PDVLYFLVVAPVVVAAAVLPERPAAIIRVALVLVGAAVFTTAVATRRPRPIVAWWLIVVSLLLQLASAIAVAPTDGLGSRTRISALVPVVLASLVLPLLALGMGVLGRTSPSGGVADVLDALMTALAVFLLVWTFVVEPQLPDERFNITVAAAYTGGTILVF